MKTQNKFNRAIATFFLLIFFPTLVPTSLYAANNGPAAPEATAFEPIDAADMVNLASGDMSYVLPLLNVPSPEGGYPLTLSNHAGIAIDQEASWVGLGWSLNPGAINRSITGVPDDWKRSQIHQIIYDAGGENTTYTGGVSVGFGKGVFSVGLYGSYSENKTFGGTTSYNTDGGVEGTAFGASARIGSDGWSVGYGGASVGSKGASIGYGGLSVSQSFTNGDTTVGYSMLNGGLGVSLSSKNGASVSVANGGFRLSGNTISNTGVSISSQAFNISIPIYFVNLDFGFSKQKYWTYEKDYTRYNGSLYAGDMVNLHANSNFSYKEAFDSYNSLYKLNSDQQSLGDNLSYIAYDNYTVSGQGISGSIKPALLQDGSLLNNHVLTSEGYNITYRNGINSTFNKNVNNDLFNNDIHFYFENEASSYFRISSDGWHNGIGNNFSNISVVNMSDMRSEIHSSLTVNGVTENFYDNVNKRKRTGSIIETFTNAEITASNSTIIIKPENFNRSTAPADGIGAFRITALDGKVYHYSIPVYQKEQFTTSTDIHHDFAYRFFEQEQLAPYATHWLLTAITGPDYVDVNSNNLVDQADYGYWTAFDYGKWTDGFNWQTPVKSNDKNKFFEWGVKEIYYLDKIKTRTHTAFFVKSERNDDVSSSFQIGSSPSNPEWKEDVSRSFIQGSDGNYYFPGIYEDVAFTTAMNYYNVPYYIKKSKFGKYIKCNQNKSLKLEKIILVKNEDSNISKNSNQDSSPHLKGEIGLYENHKLIYIANGDEAEQKNASRGSSWSGNFYNKVYDAHDFVGTNIEQKAIKTIKFDYDYDLAKNSPNSIDYYKGRLALKGVNYIGKNNLQLIPPYKFDYVKTNNGLSINQYNASNEDNWGYYKNAPFAWSLNKITTPTGAEINVLYESDDVDKVAVSSVRAFDGAVQFSFFPYGNKLRILVQNELYSNNINFQDCFQLGSVNLDLWASIRHDYYDCSGGFLGLDCGCKNRKGAVNVENTNAQVVSVATDAVWIEVDYASSTIDENNGLHGMFNRVLGYNIHDNLIRDEGKRGEWGNPTGCIGDPMDRFILKYYLKGNRVTLPDSEKNGGGIRVKQITLKDNGVVKNQVSYFYNVPGYSENKTDPNYKSSGITSFVPQKYFKEIKYRSEVPSPAVMYEFVTVKNNQTIEEYNFEVLKQESSPNSEDLVIDNILEIRKTQQLSVGSRTINGETYNLDYSKFDINDKTSSIGRLKSKKVYNKNNHLLTKFQNNYKALSLGGLTEETFSTYKRINNGDYLNYRLSATSKTKSASIPESTTVIKEGYTNTTYLENYDYITGQALQTRTVSSDGKSFKTKAVPAYKKYSQMGPKVDNINNRNMLLQTAAEYSYILDVPTNTWKETGVGITTWNNVWTYQEIEGNNTTPTLDKEKVWRKHKSYTWNGVKDNQGIFTNYVSTAETDDGFNWALGVGSQPAQWKQTSEVTLYDHYSMLLEMKDINNNRAATKMGDNDTKIMTSGNAGYNELFYTGGENLKNSIWLEPDINMSGGDTRTLTLAHTGKYAVSTTSSSQLRIFMRNGQHRAGRYKLNVWVHKANAANARINYNSTSYPFNGESYDAGDWTLKTHYINNVPTTDFNVFVNSADGTNVYYDDLMLRPVASSITGYVYNEWDELSYIVNNNGLATYFKYDKAGRLERTSVEVLDDLANGLTGGFKKKVENIQKYKNLP